MLTSQQHNQTRDQFRRVQCYNDVRVTHASGLPYISRRGPISLDEGRDETTTNRNKRNKGLRGDCQQQQQP